MSFLLDTNIVSELRKGPRANRGVREWVSSVTSTQLHISVLVIGELRQGIERLRGHDPEQAATLESWLATIQRDYGANVVPVSPEIAEQWGRMNAPAKLPAIDGLLTATAYVRQLVLVTRNSKDVADSGVQTLNPFS